MTMRSFTALLTIGLLAAAPAAGAELHVSPTGRDTDPGTKDKPLRTLEAARDAARRLAGRESVTVWLRGGTHGRDQPFSLKAEDSGTATAPVVYRAAPGEKPILTNGVAVEPTDFTKPAAAAAKRLPENARGKVVELDLAKLGVRHAGPWPDVFGDGGGLLELLCDGRRMPLARWPNEGSATMKRVLDVGDWSNGPTRHGGTFEYRDDRHARWPVAAGVWLQGYWRVPWQMETVRVRSIDADQHTVTFRQPVAGGIGSKYHRPNGSGKEPYWVVNLLEELDQPGEWCVDFPSRKLYFWPPVPVEKARVAILDRDAPIVTLKDASHVTLWGLTLESGLGNAIEVSGGRDALIAGCTVRNCGKAGVVVTGGEHHGVSGCDIYAMGGSGVVLSGGDRATLKPARHFAVNNHIHHYGQVQRVYAAAVEVGYKLPAVGVRVAHNLIHDAPHAGILYGGNDHELEYNDIHHVCLVSDDMGGMYTYHDWTSRGNVVRYNFIHDSPKAHGVYCDDGDSGDTITGNVMLKLDAGVFLGGGHDNIATGNLIVDCKVGIHIDARGVARGYNLQNKSMVERVKSANPTRPPWSERYPALAKLLDFHPELPVGNVLDGNAFVRCRRGIDRKAKPEELRFTKFGTNLELTDDPGFVAPEALDFRLREDSVVYRKLPGFKRIPFEKIGLYRDPYRTELPARERKR